MSEKGKERGKGREIMRNKKKEIEEEEEETWVGGNAEKKEGQR